MRQTIWTGTCAAIVTVATAALFAQTPAQQPPAQQPPAPATAPQTATPSTSANKVTVTGCLKAAPTAPGDTTSPAGTTGTTGTDPAATAAGATGTTGAAAAKFILTEASATPADAASAQTYRLIANPTALSEHVGKKLELVGTIDKTSTPDPKDPSAAAPALRVESGKILAATCNQ